MQESFDFGARPPRPPRERREPPIVAVSVLNAMVKQLLESGIPSVWVEGEVSGWKRHSSGHCYFCLRDPNAQVNAVMWRSDAQHLPIEPEQGMRVRALGSVTLYEKRGDFQFVVRRIESSEHDGLWRLAFERLRARLEREGLLAPERKRALPRFPQTIGVVTSPVGAALHDILHVIGRRAPWTRVIISPARVQGDGAAFDVARALGLLHRSPAPVDLIILARGGGSVEDLWAFNEEPVARAIAASPVPVVSGVGHEVDVTIADLVADVRAPTPSAAAEHAVPDGAALRDELARVRARLARGLRRYGQRRRAQLDIAGERLERRMGRLLEVRRIQLERTREQLERGVLRVVDTRRATLARLAGQIEALSPLQSLARGFAVPLDGGGRILRRRAYFEPGMSFQLRVVDGAVPCRVTDEAATS
jgi:exodeoxyribonuclease VII large subunit